MHKDFSTNFSGFVKEPILHIYAKCHDKRCNHFKDIRVLLKEAKIKIAQRSKITTLKLNFFFKFISGPEKGLFVRK